MWVGGEIKFRDHFFISTHYRMIIIIKSKKKIDMWKENVSIEQSIKVVYYYYY